MNGRGDQSSIPESVGSPASRSGPLNAALRLLWPALAVVTVVGAAAVQLHQQGRLAWCVCGQWTPWSGEAWGPHNSQHLLDPYSLTHVLHGLLLFGLAAAAIPSLAVRWRLALSVCIESVWEVFENSAFVIARYRAATAALGYEGDTVANSMGDILSCAIGFWLAGRLGFRKSLALFLAVELLLLAWIRDSLILNVVMLLRPIDAVRTWQTGG